MVLCLIVVSIMEARRIMENSLSHGSTGVLWPCLRPIFKLLYKASGLRRITIAKCPNDTVPFSLMFNLNKQVEEHVDTGNRLSKSLYHLPWAMPNQIQMSWRTV